MRIDARELVLTAALFGAAPGGSLPVLDNEVHYHVDHADDRRAKYQRPNDDAQHVAHVALPDQNQQTSEYHCTHRRETSSVYCVGGSGNTEQSSMTARNGHRRTAFLTSFAVIG